MAGITINARLKGNRELVAALRRMNPRKNPGLLRRPMERSGVLIQNVMVDRWLSGPRPKRLGRRTGKTAASIGIDRSGLPLAIRVGSRSDFLDAFAYARGKQRRFAVIRLGVQEALKVIPPIFLEEWEREVQRRR